MKKVLIITYYWPPASGPGVFRFLKFVKFLPKYGYIPYVLTVKNGSYPSIDKSLLNEESTDLNVTRTYTLEPFALFNKLTGNKGKSLPVGIAPQKKDSVLKKLMFYIRANYFIPDARKGWNIFAYKKAKRIISSENIDYLITTGPPHSTHLIGLKLKRNLNSKWIADFRDPWTNIYYNQFFPRTKKTEIKDKKLESKVLEQSDVSIAVSHGLVKEFEDRAKKIELIPNGFDLGDIPSRKIIRTENFVLSYVGNFKTNQNIPVIWEALSELKSEIKDFSKNFRLHITGNCVQDVQQKIMQFALNDIVELKGHVNHETAIRKMLESNMLLFIIPKSENNKLILTGKLFEYLATQTPILSIGPLDGDADRLLKKQKRNEMIDYEDKTRFKDIIKKFYFKWLDNKKLVVTAKSDLSSYSREKLTEKLAQILDSL